MDYVLFESKATQHYTIYYPLRFLLFALGDNKNFPSMATKVVLLRLKVMSFALLCNTFMYGAHKRKRL
jgi:hypothetical protein